MLKTMRKNVKSLAPTLWIVIAAFIITIFAVWGGAGRLGESRGTNVIATIGKDKITAEFYVQNLRQRLEILKREFKDLNSKLIQQLNIPMQVLEINIQNIILIQTAMNMGIDASSEEIRKQIMDYPVFQKDGKFIGFEEYKKILYWNRLSISEFEENLKAEIIREKVKKVLTAGTTISPEELWENYKNRNETAKLEYITLETEKIELNEEPLSSEIQEHFEKNKEKYKIPETREASLVFISTEDLKKEIEVTEPEVEKYYNKNQSQFKEPERVKVSRIYLPYENKEKDEVIEEAQNILEKIRNGEDFGELATKYSKDEKAKERGDWGLFEWKRLSAAEQEEIGKLEKGETSDARELEEGISILQVTEKKGPETKPLEDVKERITDILKDQKARETAEEKISSLEKRAKKEKNLEVAAQKNGFKVKKTGTLKENETITDIDPSGTISTNMFQLKENEISSLIYTYKGAGIVQLEKIEPPRQANFEEVKNEVKEKVIELKMKEKALKKMNEIRAELKGRSLESLAEKHGIEYKTVDNHMRGQYLSTIGESTKFDQLAFSLPINNESDPIELENCYALIRVLDRKEVTKEDFEKEKEKEKENLLEMKRNKLLHSHIAKLREEKGVKINYNLFLKINSEILSRYEGDQ